MTTAGWPARLPIGVVSRSICGPVRESGARRTKAPNTMKESATAVAAANR
jgi:hypothetical protein